MLELDLAILRFLRTRGHAPQVEKAAQLLAKSGEHGALWFALGLLAAAADRPRRSRWLRAAAVGPAAIGLNYGIKLLVKRPRPQLEGLPPLGGAPSSLSFPSAHAAASFAAATTFGRIEPQAKAPALSLAVLMALTRPYLGMHYPSDVLAGALLGRLLGRLIPLGERD
jgi:membrane-associated phospholipid phosphatase